MDDGQHTEDHTEQHAAVNRRYWNSMAHQWEANGEAAWSSSTPTWGMWELPDGEVGLVPADLTGVAAVELGCGTAYWAGWLARRGARVMAVDVSDGQLATAARLVAAHGAAVHLVQADAERVPAADASFDLAFSEYGAAIWCDPRVWIPEAHRLLRPGGELIFLGCHPLAMICLPDDGSVPTSDQLVRPYLDLHRLDWTGDEPDPGGIEFNLPISAWISLFVRTGFEVLDHRELRAPAEVPDHEVRYFASARWAKRHPTEQVWRLRKR